MLRRETRSIETETYGESRSVKASFSLSGMKFIIRMLSKIYSDSYGSIVREITSNCFDAHKAANQNEKPVILSIESRDDAKYIVFRDFGNGMSPDFMANTYMTYGESTKRESADQFGYFGIGSKSGLSIRNEYYIDAFIDGTEYNYIIYIGDDELPEFDIIGEGETEELNGCKVRLEIRDDLHLFKEAIKGQLKYFTDVYFKGDELKDFNDYEVLEYKNFIVNNSTIFNKKKGYYSLVEYNADISFDRVRYRLDLNSIGITDSVSLPIGLKFGINDLVPTPSREDIVYDEDSVQLVREKLADSLMEIVDLYNLKAESVYTDYYQWINAYENYRDKSYVNELNPFTAEKLLAEQFDIEYPCNRPRFLPFEELGLKPKAYDSYKRIDQIYEHLVRISSVIRSGSNLKSKRYTDGISIIQALKPTYPYPVYAVKKGELLDKDKNKYLDNAVIITRKLKHSISNKKQFIKWINGSFIIDSLKRKKNIYTQIGKIILKHVIIPRVKSYAKVEIPESFLESIKEDNASINRDKVVVNVIDRSSRYKSDTKYRYTIQELVDKHVNNNKKRKNRHTLLIVCSNDEKKKAEFFHTRYIISDAHHYKFITMANRNKEKLLSLNEENIVSLNTFISESKAIKKLIAGLILKHKVSIPDYSISVYKFSSELSQIISKLDKYRSHTHSYHMKNFTRDDENLLELELLKLDEALNLADPELYELIDKLEVYKKKLKYLQYFSHQTPDEVIVDYFKECKVLLNKSKYKVHAEFSKFETELVHENHRKLVYLQSINKHKSENNYGKVNKHQENSKRKSGESGSKNGSPKYDLSIDFGIEEIAKNQREAVY